MASIAVDSSGVTAKGYLQILDRPIILLAIGMSASMFAVGGRWDVALAAWVAPIFLLRFVRISSPHVALPIIWLTSVANAWFWGIEINHHALTASEYTIALTFGTIFALPYFVDRMLTPRLGVFGKLMVFPAAWACTEFLMGSLSPLGAIYGLRANTQTDNLALLQLASVLGPYSIGLLINWLATTINWIWEERNNFFNIRAVAATYGVALALVLVGGGLRLALTPVPNNYVSMAAITPSMYVENAARRMIYGRTAAPHTYADDDEMHSATSYFANKNEVARTSREVTRAAYALVQDNLLESSRAAARAGAKVVVWSETAAPLLDDADKSAFLAKVADVARAEKVYILAMIGEPFAKNQSNLVGPDGNVIWSYDKRHPVPLLEPVPPGHASAPTVQTPFGRLTSVICFDADFPAQSRVNADVMMVGGHEWPELGATHTLKWVRLRAIENGYSLIRASYFGQSAAFDALGHVLATQNTSGPNNHIMYAELPTGGSRTIYNRIGDVVIWLSLAGLVLATIEAFGPRRKVR